MTWFIFALICLLGWGFADLFYKKGTDENDTSSHLKIGVWVGLTMGIVSIILLFTTDSSLTNGSFFISIIKYSPASLSYIISMIIGYASLRYLELSIVSPLQNASGALSAILMLIYFVSTNSISSITEEFSIFDLSGTVLIVIGVITLAIVQNKLSKDEKLNNSEIKKYRFGALALLFPLMYCIFDTIGTAFDGIILNEETGLNLSETDVLILYGITFFIAGIICYIILLIKNKKFYNPFQSSEKSKCFASIFEEFGQIFYVFAMAKNPVLSAPMISSYCIVSVLLSRIILKEKLKTSQTISIIIVILGIILLGISESISI